MGDTSVVASPRMLEKLDISGGDHEVGINNKVAYGVICSAAGEILKIDTDLQEGYTTVPLQAGFNPLTITKVYQTGSTVSGTIDLIGW